MGVQDLTGILLIAAVKTVYVHAFVAVHVGSVGEQDSLVYHLTSIASPNPIPLLFTDNLVGRNP